MNLQILDRAEDDLVEGYWFYESQQAGLDSQAISELNDQANDDPATPSTCE